MNDPTPVSTALFPSSYLERRSLYRDFMESQVFPNERLLDLEDDAALDLVASLQEEARSAGLWAPLPEAEVAVTSLDAGAGFAAAVAVAGDEVPEARRFELAPEGT